jgi:hypothetical protein
MGVLSFASNRGRFSSLIYNLFLHHVVLFSLYEFFTLLGFSFKIFNEETLTQGVMSYHLFSPQGFEDDIH